MNQMGFVDVFLFIKHSCMGLVILNNKYKNLVLVVGNMNKEDYYLYTFY